MRKRLDRTGIENRYSRRRNRQDRTRNSVDIGLRKKNANIMSKNNRQG